MKQVNSVVITDETFDNTWPFQARYNEASGFRMHYVDEGYGKDTLLLLHGEPTWSYLFRQQIRLWSKHFRVIAVDHMGFGKSESPQERNYWLQDHIDNLERFILDLDLNGLTLVMHDFGGPTGMGVAIRHPKRIKRIVSVNAPTPAGQPDLIKQITLNVSKSNWFKWILKAEKERVLDQILGQLNYNILSTLKLNGFERNEIITRTWIRAYQSPFASPMETQGAIGWAKGFAKNLHRFEIPDEQTKIMLSKKPALVIWGEADQTLNHQHFLPLFKQTFPKGQVHILPKVGHYSPEDAPKEVGELVMKFITN